MAASSTPVVILVGAPGSGKGTQAVLLSRELGLAHVATGDMFREAMASDSDLGRKVKGYLDAGNLVPDELTIDLVQERLMSPSGSQGIVLDGFPRTVPQGQALSQLLDKLGRSAVAVVELAVPEVTLLERIMQRGLAGSGRSDDRAEVAANRLKVFWEQTAPVIAYYRDRGELRSINGLGTVEEVQVRIRGVLREVGIG